MIHQELQHVPHLTVAQNMFLGRPLTAGRRPAGRPSRRRSAAPPRCCATSIPRSIPPRPIRDAEGRPAPDRRDRPRPPRGRAKIIAMDEPTSSLTPAEFDRLAVLIAQLAATGVSIIYVSHKMDEVFRRLRPRHHPARRPSSSTCVDLDRRRRGRHRRPHGRPRARPSPHTSASRRDDVMLEVARPGARRAVQRRQLRPPPRRGAGHLGPGRRRAGPSSCA